ncbi:hypothetical protein GCM10012280_44880 [Wenjunlia tyrosinilytica]|uniref:Uncharacterized protein n=1 Tax=Wenjunlia tyrosinilytica TaxID=1544741 RepID=A0A918E008_9ACTN|nr:hypothetical protein GCM10012280_44880 [Wenjunlia tyrosinilytica]
MPWTPWAGPLRPVGCGTRARIPVVRAFVLRGSPSAFRAGDDIGEFFRLTTAREARDLFRPAKPSEPRRGRRHPRLPGEAHPRLPGEAHPRLRLPSLDRALTPRSHL